MANNNNTKNLNVPNLRFPEFTGEWKETTLGKCVIQPLDYGMNAAAITYDGENKYIRITDIDEQSSQYISDSPVSPAGQLLDKYIVEENDILFARTGASTGKTYLYKKKDGKLYFAGFLIRAKIKTEYNSTFIFAQTKTAQYYKWVEFMSIRSGQPGINSQEYASYRFLIPQKEEQDKIASLLSLLDERITTQIKIIEDLKKLKSSLLDLLFQNNSKWSTYCISEILTIGNGRDYKHLKEGNIPVYGTGGYMLSVNDYLYEGESVCIGRKGTIDMPMFLTGKFWTVDTLFYTHNFRNILPKFCYYLFTMINWQRYNEASGVPSLSKATIEKIKVSVPSINEQVYICSILDSVNNKIDVERSILNEFKKQKQHLLQQMFV